MMALVVPPAMLKDGNWPISQVSALRTCLRCLVLCIAVHKQNICRGTFYLTCECSERVHGLLRASCEPEYTQCLEPGDQLQKSIRAQLTADANILTQSCSSRARKDC